MKVSEKSDSKKKEKSALVKAVSSSLLGKKSDLRKLRIGVKEETVAPAPRKPELKSPTIHTASTSNSKSTSGSSSNVARSSKFGICSTRASPKYHLVEITSIYSKKPSCESIVFMPMSKTSSKIEHPLHNAVKEEVKRSLANVVKVYPNKNRSYLDVSLTEISDCLPVEEKLYRNDFAFLSVIGEGGYGKVWKVEHYKTRNIYALKEMSKSIIVMKKSVENVLNEMKILSKLRNPFIANMAFAFNDRENLYLGMDYLQGGDLRTFLCDSEKLNEEETKFLIACIIKAVEYIHSNKIFHRDIKPENLVLDNEGYLRLTDFGIARSLKEKQLLDTSGTPGYMAPEVLCKQIHSFSVDFYAIGIIAYELTIGRRPYNGNNRNEIRDAILAKQHTIKKSELPSRWSADCVDFINRLIERNPLNRLGSKMGIEELKNHPWFSRYPWKQLESKKLQSPFKMRKNVPTFTDRFDSEEYTNQYRLLQRAEQKVDIFGGYFFNMIH